MNNIITYDPNYNRDKKSDTSSPEAILTFSEDKIFYAEESFLKIFSFPLISGSAEGTLSEPNTAVITESTARKYFGDQNPLDKILTITNDQGIFSYKITGVLKDVPDNSHIKFNFLLSFKTLMNIAIRDKGKEIGLIWGWNAFNTYVQLDPKANKNNLESKFPIIVNKYNLSGDWCKKRVFLLQALKDIHLKSNLRYEPEINGNLRVVNFLSIIAIFILLVAWINYINLTTAKSVLRAKEIGVRKVLGSRRIELIKQYLFETFLFNLIALLVAITIVEILMPNFIQFTGKSLTLSLSNKIWYWLGLSILSGSILSGIYPAFVLSSFNPISVIKGSFIKYSKGIILRKSLVTFQFVISIILIISTITVYNQLSFIRNQDLGMNIDQTLIIKSPSRQNDFAINMQKFKDELLKYTSIKNVTFSSTIPSKEYSNAASGIRPFQSNPDDGKRCFFIDIDKEFFNFYKIELVAGENFKITSRYNESVILNEQAVKILGFGNPENAVNKKMILGGLNNQIVEVIGVVKDYHHKSLNNPIEAVIFNPPSNVKYFSIKYNSTDIDQIITLSKNIWDEIFPKQPFDYYFLNDVFNAQYKSDEQFGKTFSLFTCLTILISCLGFFGLISFAISKRTKEIAIRKVLGASVKYILSMLIKEMFILFLLANLIAWPVAYYAMNKWLENFAYRISIEWWVFLVAGFTTLLIALLTISWQALKAATANPVESLKYE
ncbi:ABC transporter permease [Bacteroidota bacterium]